MSPVGQQRRIEAVGDESALPPIADVSLRRGEPLWAASVEPLPGLVTQPPDCTARANVVPTYCESVTVAADGDADGQSAASAFLRGFKRGDVRAVAVLPSGRAA